MDLFEYQKEKLLKKEAPLANRLRPQTLEEFVGQEHIIGKDTLLYRAIKADKISSLILYGPSGTGKTTLAKIISNITKSNFIQINGVVSGAKDIKEVADKAKINISINGKKTILFIDEIHRFNKMQQDILLPYVEEGTIILIGATTENPYFEVNKALISRSIIFKLEQLSNNNIKKIIKRAIEDDERGLGHFNIKIDEDALDFLANICNGDARIALNAIELAGLTTEKIDDYIHIDLKIAQQCIQKRAINYDKNGDNHYDTISAFIKSMRGSDPDAAVYYLAKMLYAGEDPKFIARRIVICASEDVGNADPRALQIAVSAFQATEMIGMPECRIILSQAVCYVASAPKSNSSYVAINKAMEDVKNIKIKQIPPHLKDCHYNGATQLGNGIDYKYAHNYEKNYVNQQYLPDEIKNNIYYEPSDNGYEKNIKKWLEFLKTN
ncbi:replication-associated recombination protein A [[Clostridium] colinum]|uniref:replication-associated recombination protein A n=1 Tax=[Clostridium] colinum TaxID=36835 RepID=UPI0020257A72|nr:replication-associated recombination protein A [[Clostridium] colinum]